MRSPRRLASALVLAALAALGVAERAALHAHPLEENDLVQHALAVIESGRSCDGGAHFDAGRLGDHPACSECILAAAALAVSPSEPARLAAADGRRLAAPPGPALPPSNRPSPSGARGPPAI